MFSCHCTLKFNFDMKAILSYLTFTFIGVILTILIISFKPQDGLEEKEYMTILVVTDESGSNITAYISTNGEGYIKEELSGKVNKQKGAFDYNPALKLLIEYQRGGWHIQNNNLTISDKSTYENHFCNYFFLTRQKNTFKKK